MDDEVLHLDTLKERLSEFPKDKFILFKGDEKAEFGKFVDILQILKELGLSNFLIITLSCMRSRIISANITPMAGELVSPGDSMPAASKKSGASDTSSTINS